MLHKPISRVAGHAAGLIFFVCVAKAVTVSVPNDLLRVEPLRSALQLTLTENGKPVADAAVELFWGKPSQINDLPYETLTTDSGGKAITSELPFATYYLRAGSRDRRKAEFSLHVPLGTRTQAAHGKFELLVTALEPMPEVESVIERFCAEAKALQAELINFRGVVTDPIGAVIVGTEIVVYKAENPKKAIAKLTTDSSGEFSADLSSGKYLVTFHSREFAYQRVFVLIGERGSRDLHLSLTIGNCELPVTNRQVLKEPAVVTQLRAKSKTL